MQYVLFVQSMCICLNVHKIIGCKLIFLTKLFYLVLNFFLGCGLHNGTGVDRHCRLGNPSGRLFGWPVSYIPKAYVFVCTFIFRRSHTFGNNISHISCVIANSSCWPSHSSFHPDICCQHYDANAKICCTCSIHHLDFCASPSGNTSCGWIHRIFGKTGKAIKYYILWRFFIYYKVLPVNLPFPSIRLSFLSPKRLHFPCLNIDSKNLRFN